MRRFGLMPFRNRRRVEMLWCCAAGCLLAVVSLRSASAQSMVWPSEPDFYRGDAALGFPSPYSRPDTGQTFQRVFIETEPQILHGQGQVLKHGPMAAGAAGMTPFADAPAEAPVPAPPVEPEPAAPHGPETDPPAPGDDRGTQAQPAAPTFLEPWTLPPREAATPRDDDRHNVGFPPPSSAGPGSQQSRARPATRPTTLEQHFQQALQSRPASLPQREGFQSTDLVGPSAMTRRTGAAASTVPDHERPAVHQRRSVVDGDSTLGAAASVGRSPESVILRLSAHAPSPSHTATMHPAPPRRELPNERHSPFRDGIEASRHFLGRGDEPSM